MDNLELKVIQPTGITLKEEGDHIVIPGVDGDFGVSAGHTPFLTKIRPGVIELFIGKELKKYAIHDGFVTVEKDIVTIVTDTFETATDIDKERADSAKQRAEKRLNDKGNKEINFRRAEFALKRAVARLQTIKSAD
jgi:F-type H+-transporting ATPase subunit epsilon